MSFIYIEKSIQKNEWSMNNLHSHSNYEIYYLKKGKRKYLLSNALYNLQAPSIIIIPPHVMHKTEGEAFERYNVYVSPSCLDDFQSETLENQSLKIINLTSDENNDLLKLFELHDNIDKQSKNSKHIIKAIFSSLILFLSTVRREATQPSVTSLEEVPSLLLNLMDYINNHYTENITLTTLSEHFFVSKGTVIYNFKKHANCSPIDFLLSVRLTKAKELLLNTNKRIDEIAEVCGFSSANYFGLIFKQKEGLSPASYRKYERQRT
jgi:YesN/AraC family two-component response regulator